MCFSKCAPCTPWYCFCDVWQISPMPSDWFPSNREIFSHLALVNFWLSPDRLLPWLWADYFGLGFGLLDRACGIRYPSATICIWTLRECSTFGYFMAFIDIMLHSLFRCRLWTFLVHLLTSFQAFRTWLGPLWISLSFSLCGFWLWFSNFKIKLMNHFCMWESIRILFKNILSHL